MSFLDIIIAQGEKKARRSFIKGFFLNNDGFIQQVIKLSFRLPGKLGLTVVTGIQRKLMIVKI